jgi:hypothetical protein
LVDREWMMTSLRMVRGLWEVSQLEGEKKDAL